MQSQTDLANKYNLNTIAEQVNTSIETTWAAVLASNADKLAHAYSEGGDMAYGSYLGLLFRPINRALAQQGLLLTPPLPGDLNQSREWGDTETDRQRWMWSLVATDGQVIGALALVVYHDHTQFALPRAPMVLALAATDDQAVIAALSAQFEPFGTAIDFIAEVAAYLAQEAAA
jgi:Family of unknown function (DUF6022)